MAKFKIILSDPETGESQITDLEGSRAVPLVGRKLGETIDGAAVGLGGHKLKITGGSDKDGFPMRPDIHGGVKTKIIVSNGVGFHSTHKGARRRKTVRGSVITEDTVQINMKIVEKPKKTGKAEAKKEEKPRKAEAPEDKPSEQPTDEKIAEQPKKENETKTGGQ
jgi:small subunit ribosomal protein S6e